MRPFVIGAVTMIALVAVAAALARLGGTVGQLRALEVAPRSQVLDAAQPQLAAPISAPISARDSDDEDQPPAGIAADKDVARTAGGDEHITRWLAEDPEFARAAEELLQDPNPAVQLEARELLRELGAGPEANAER